MADFVSEVCIKTNVNCADSFSKAAAPDYRDARDMAIGAPKPEPESKPATYKSPPQTLGVRG